MQRHTSTCVLARPHCKPHRQRWQQCHRPCQRHRQRHQQCRRSLVLTRQLHRPHPQNQSFRLILPTQLTRVVVPPAVVSFQASFQAGATSGSADATNDSVRQVDVVADDLFRSASTTGLESELRSRSSASSPVAGGLLSSSGHGSDRNRNGRLAGDIGPSFATMKVGDEVDEKPRRHAGVRVPSTTCPARSTGETCEPGDVIGIPRMTAERVVCLIGACQSCAQRFAAGDTAIVTRVERAGRRGRRSSTRPSGEMFVPAWVAATHRSSSNTRRRPTATSPR